jgi:23S rRNA (adenine2030-N6)-methyltransferase
MLAYRHAFHAGNHADALKHIAFVAVLRYLFEKDKPVWIVDTHAGAGGYGLDSKYASQHDEFETGVGPLWRAARDVMPAAVADWLSAVRGFNGVADRLVRYPGSPEIARALARADDRIRCFELHPTDFEILDANAGRDPRVKALHADGFDGLKALLPPPSRRGVVFVDPSYELKVDYERVVAMLKDALVRFATGVYVVWLPVLVRPEPARTVERLKRLPAKTWLHARLEVAAPEAGGFGMLGSHLFVLNPPWKLEAQLREALPYLVKMLGQFDGAGWGVESGGAAEGVDAVAAAGGVARPARGGRVMR